MLVVYPRAAAPATRPRPTPQTRTGAQAVTVDPLLGRSLLALAVGLALILAGLLLDAS